MSADTTTFTQVMTLFFADLRAGIAATTVASCSVTPRRSMAGATWTPAPGSPHRAPRPSLSMAAETLHKQSLVA